MTFFTPQYLRVIGGLLLFAALANDFVNAAFVNAADEVAGKAKSQASAKAQISLILLQSKLPELNEELLGELVFKAWQVRLRSGAKFANTGEECVFKNGASFVIQTKNSRLQLTAKSMPYRNTEDIEGVDDLRARKMLTDHRAWISIEGTSVAVASQADANASLLLQIASLTAELVDKNTLGIILPSHDILLPRPENLQALLREKTPVAALLAAANVPVVNASDDDPRIKAAVATAKKTWPDFVKAFNAKAANTESFGVKFPFPADARQEFMWIEVTSVDEGFVSGRLANDPVWCKDLKLGDEVRKKITELADWMYLKDGELVGGFSVKVLLEQQEKATRPDSPQAK